VPCRPSSACSECGSPMRPGPGGLTLVCAQGHVHPLRGCGFDVGIDNDCDGAPR